MSKNSEIILACQPVVTVTKMTLLHLNEYGSISVRLNSLMTSTIK
jgi:hypothetical protein